MITFDFEYYRPSTIDEAVNTFQKLSKDGKNPIYYAGGTEIISRSRLHQMEFGAVIDIKEIPECNVLRLKDGKLILGSALTLTRISDAGIFSLLGEACKAAADHTARDKITLGGNICGKTPYKESILPFLISDSVVMIAGKRGTRKVPINQVFGECLELKEGEFLVQVIVDECYTSLPYYGRKKTKHSKVDYPLVCIAALQSNKEIRVALSGVCSYPFRSKTIEKILNDENIPNKIKIEKVIQHLSGLITNDIQGSAEYREFVLNNLLSDTLEAFEGVIKC